MKKQKTTHEWVLHYGQLMHRVGGLYWANKITADQWGKYRDRLQRSLLNKTF